MTESMPSQPEPIEALAEAEINLPPHLIPTFGRADLWRLRGAGVLLFAGLGAIGLGVWFVSHSLPDVEMVKELASDPGSPLWLVVWMIMRTVAFFACIAAGYGMLSLADRLSQPLHLKIAGARDPRVSAEDLSNSIALFIERVAVPVSKAAKSFRKP